MYWIGSKAAIDAAEALAAAKVVGQPEYLDGVRLPRSEWVTERWAEPAQTGTPDVWAIPVYPAMALPDGCEISETIDLMIE